MMGKSEALKNLNKELRAIKGKTIEGLTVSAMLVRSRSQALTPVDTGNLKASTYNASGGTSDKPVVEVGYTADYAVKVHEDLGVYHKTGQAKFLETAIEKSKGDILDIVKKRARIT